MSEANEAVPFALRPVKELQVLARSLHEAADTTDDAADHDEIHAAAAMVERFAGLPHNSDYITRWFDGVLERARCNR